MSLSERAAKAAKIAAEPQLYKVCEGCDSIVTKRVATCPSCHGYRFIEDANVVIRAGEDPRLPRATKRGHRGSALSKKELRAV